ncbi:MAG: glycosyltransferase family 39 protein [Nitrososphaerales archaeon]
MNQVTYIVSGMHLSFGYVDFPPFIALVAAMLNAISSDSLFSIHVVSALADACLIFVSAMIVRELGGRRGAQLFAAAATLFSGALAFGSIFSMDIFDALWWTLLAYIVVRIIKRDEPKLWLLFGVVAGIGLNTKLTIVFFLLSIVIGLALSPARSYFRSKWLWFGGAIALVFMSPYVIWNALNGWPTVDFYFHHGGLNGSGPADFVALQFLITNPLAFPLAIMGLYFFLRNSAGKGYRVLGFSFIILFLAFLIFNGKPYFMFAAYPMLFAGGAVLIQNSSLVKRRTWLPKIYIATIIVLGIILAPLLMPILPPATYASTYGSFSGVGNSAAGQQNNGIFPQYLGDRFGWDTMTATVAQVYNALPAQEKARACIFTSNYGEASALTFLGKQFGLPHVISGHNNFYLWGPGNCTGQVIITVGVSQSDDLQSFYNVTQAGLITCEYCQAEENNLTIYICTHPRASEQTIWPEVKHFN